MKAYQNKKRLLFGILSTLLLCCNLVRAAALFDPLKGHVPAPKIHPIVGDSPCVWPDPRVLIELLAEAART
jgi:hypothetical protein